MSRLELVIDGNLSVHGLTWAECWRRLDAAYGHDAGRYDRNLRWVIRDVVTGQIWRREMEGGIWDACCETAEVLRLFLLIDDEPGA